MNFTVLMSLYHKENPTYLRQCLDSLVKQSLPAEEILIIKDGPLTEELDAILDDFQEQYPKQTTIQAYPKNRGLGLALQDGVQLARNEWIARMDTDDICRTDRFEKQINYLKEHPEVELLGSDVFEFDQSPKEPTARKVVPHSYQDILGYAKRRNPFNHMTVIYKKSAILKAGNYQPLKGYEDYYLWVRMLKNGVKAANLDDTLVYARADQNMFKRRGGWDYFVDGSKAYQKIYQVGLASPLDWLIRMGGQAVFNLVPNSLRQNLYKKILRK
ncbi:MULTISPECIES: glycosyltransferase [Aerococcus]|uniref:glycosyltransferase n=1 Tax=Aerococcus urinae (strain CCUG 59500 / ACS-120-V-Col10a) TaxID=2976812 RepID=UPI000200F23D|nr:glycosyltransferase [Aerococcus sp. Group 1]AEA00895.1 glycosyltransferase, group 2 family protein [Aerococcus sp. Group 1]MCY3054404.1 glycosyltransferase [Aerococcus sp. Group 1]MCY3056134.1 glycosyltransferase [Aerococcus sp. Group 1]MCY3061111.1 glycosyltransferase [Aerococcus sp. Group 1]